MQAVPNNNVQKLKILAGSQIVDLQVTILLKYFESTGMMFTKTISL